MGLHHVGLAPGLTALDLTGCCKVPQAGSFSPVNNAKSLTVFCITGRDVAWLDLEVRAQS